MCGDMCEIYKKNSYHYISKNNNIRILYYGSSRSRVLEPLVLLPDHQHSLTKLFRSLHYCSNMMQTNDILWLS